MKRPWLAPFMIVALVVPPVAGFAFGGPALGLALGALEVGTIIVIAARSKLDGQIEISDGSRNYALLVLALAPVERPAQAARVVEIARAGALAESPEIETEPEILVLAPATNERLAHWLSDVEEARFDAQRRLALTLGTLAAAGVDARGSVGDPDPVQAVEDELRSYRARELVVVTGASPADAAIAELTRRLPLEVRRLDAE